MQSLPVGQQALDATDYGAAQVMPDGDDIQGIYFFAIEESLYDGGRYEVVFIELPHGFMTSGIMDFAT